MPRQRPPRQRRNSRPVRVYLNGGRFWGDFRKYADVGGKREPLVLPGSRLATDDPTVARRLADSRQALYEAARAPQRSAGAIGDDQTLRGAVAAFLGRKKAEAEGAVADRQNRVARQHELVTNLAQVVGMLEADGIVRLADIDRGAISRLAERICQTPGRDGPLSESSQRKRLMALSAVLTDAVGRGLVNHNPIHRHPAVPSAHVPAPAEGVTLPPKDRHLPPWDVQRLVDVLVERTKDQRHPRAPRAALVAILLVYTGLRLREATGLEWQHVDPPPNARTPGTIRVVRTKRRDLKNKGAARQVPLWPACWAILDAAATRLGIARDRDGLVVPGESGGMITRIHGTLRAALIAAGLPAVTPHGLRHTYATARLRCTLTSPTGVVIAAPRDRIARELGHASETLIAERYGHDDGRPTFLIGSLLDYADAARLVYPARKTRKSTGATRAGGTVAARAGSRPAKRASGR